MSPTLPLLWSQVRKETAQQDITGILRNGTTCFQSFKNAMQTVGPICSCSPPADCISMSSSWNAFVLGVHSTVSNRLTHTQIYHHVDKWCLDQLDLLKAKRPFSCPEHLWKQFDLPTGMRHLPTVKLNEGFQKNGRSSNTIQSGFIFCRVPHVSVETGSDPTGIAGKVNIKLQQGSMKVGSFLPVRCVASWAKSADSKYCMLTWAGNALQGLD